MGSMFPSFTCSWPPKFAYSLKLGVPAYRKLNNYLVLTFTMCPKVPRTNKGHTGAHNVAIAAEKSRMES